MDAGTIFRADSNKLGFANYSASGTGEDNAGAEMTGVSTSEVKVFHWLGKVKKISGNIPLRA